MKFLIPFLLLSCASYKKSQIYSSVAGGVLGAFVGSTVGQELSPNPQSDNFNRNIGATTGMLIGAYLGKKMGEEFYKSDPENFEGEELEPIKRNNNNQLIELKSSTFQLSDLGLKINPSNSETFITKPTKELPAKYHGDIQKQLVIKHRIPERKIHLPDGRTYILKGTELIEHRYTR